MMKAVPITSSLALATFLTVSAFGGAITLTVTNTDDAGAGSLRQAIADAAGGDTLDFAAGLSGGTITLAGTELLIDKDLTVDASSLPDGITVDAAGGSRVVHVATNATVTIDSLNIAGGTTSFLAGGGGILNEGSLTLRRCSVFGNTTMFGRSGGGILNEESLTMKQCSVFDNHTDSSAGGILNGDEGDQAPAMLTMEHCTVFGNTSRFAGGGFLNNDLGTTIVSHCTIASNVCREGGAGAGIFNRGICTLGFSIVAGNSAPIQPNVSGNACTSSGPSLTGGDPQLMPLGDYGGPTLTMMPMADSPAIDAAIGSTATNDQRGRQKYGHTSPSIRSPCNGRGQ